MEKNFKLIETKTHQVLIEKRESEEDEKPVVVVVAHIENVRACATLGYRKEKDRDAYFEKFNLEDAELFLKSIVSQIS